MGVLSHHKKSTLLNILLLFTTTLCDSATESFAAVVEENAKVIEITSDLDHAETKDPKKLEIVKQIRRLNNDGSYTVGFEADDGTFKFESRDVLGNVKGTYGYVDDNGEIKRVSYTANNGTGIRGPGGVLEMDETSTAARPNRTMFLNASTTRRPTSLAYLTSSVASPTRPSVIQSIPRKRLIVPYPNDKLNANPYYIAGKQARDNLETTTVVYATSLPNSKSSIQIRPTSHPNYATRTHEQIIRPEKLEIDQISNVQITSNRETSTSKPVTEDIEEKEPERRPSRGNLLRRQLSQERLTTQGVEVPSESKPQIIYSQADGEGGGHIYGGANGVTRPIFTNPTTRIPAVVLAARHRASQLQNVLNSNIQNTTPTTTTEKTYRTTNRNENAETVFEQTTESTSENSYLTQTDGPIVQIPPNRETQAAADGDSVVLRRRPIPPQNFESLRQRDYVRQFGPPQRGSYRLPQQDREQYFRETSQNDQQFVDENLAIPPNMYSYRQQKRLSNDRPFIPQSQELQKVTYEPQPYQNVPQQIPYRHNPYQQFPERPLTTRDFERLLQILVLRHQQVQQHSNYGYYGNSNYSPFYPSAVPPYYGYQQIPRPPIYDPVLYDPRSPYYRNPGSLRQYSERENSYQAQNQIEEEVPAYEGQRLIPRKKTYNQRLFGAGGASAPYTNELSQSQGQENYLPSDVREDLLYRMLMLAIHGENSPQHGPISSPSTSHEETISAPSLSSSAAIRDNMTPYSKKPVRSVEIIGEDF